MRFVLALLFLLGTGAPIPVWGHASLLSTEPADGARLDRASGEVRLRFDEPVGLISLRLVGPGGAEVVFDAAPAVHGAVLHATYRPDLPAGAYVLSYRVTSADSHPVAGAITFGIGAAAPIAPGDEGGGVWMVPSLTARFLFYLSTLVVAGGCLFRAFVAELGRRTRRRVSGLAIAGLALAALQVGLRGALLAGGSGRALLESETWRLGAGTTLAGSLALTAGGLAVCAATLQSERSLLGAFGAVLVAAGFTLSGHAATAEPRWLTAPAVGLHALAVAVWLGGLLALFVALGGAGAVAARAASRFSRLAVPTVAVLVACGLTLAAVQLEHPAALVETAYGLLLCGKLGLLVLLLGLAGWNRNRLTPALLAGAPGAARTMRASIAAEAVLAGFVLALTSVLTLTPPPRAEVHEAVPVLIMATKGDVMAHFEVSPARPGRNRIGVSLFPESIAPKEAWLELSQKAADVGPLRRQLAPDGAGGWQIDGIDLPIPGRWTLRLELLLTDYDQLTLTADLDLP